MTIILALLYAWEDDFILKAYLMMFMLFTLMLDALLLLSWSK